MGKLTKKQALISSIVLWGFALVSFTGLVLGIKASEKDFRLANQRIELKTLTEYGLLLERESLLEMEEKRRESLELATWNVGKRRNEAGVYSAFETRVETKVEEDGGKLAMKVNYPKLSNETCLDLVEVAIKLKKPYTISDGACTSKGFDMNWVSIYFPDKKA